MQFDTSKYLEYLNEQAFGNNILYLKQTPSTNDTLWNKISNNNHMIIITDKQTKLPDYLKEETDDDFLLQM